MAKMALGGQFDDEKTQQEMLLEKDHQIATMQRVIDEQERRINDFQEAILKKVQQVSVTQAALNRKEREYLALDEGKMKELKAMTVLLAEKEKENAELRAKLQKADPSAMVSKQIAEGMEHLADHAFKSCNEGGLCDNPKDGLFPTTFLGDFTQATLAPTGDGVFFTQVTLPGLPETAPVSDANGNLIRVSSDTVDVEIFPDILRYEEEAADHVEANFEGPDNDCHHCSLKFPTYNQLMKHLKQSAHKSWIHCDVCEKKFTSKYTLKTHKKQAHSSDSLFTCTKCGQRFKNRKRCKRHQANDALHQRLKRLVMLTTMFII